jgi:hypothetical protein
MVNMSNDGKISNVADVCHRRGILRLRGDREKLRQFYRFSIKLALDEYNTVKALIYMELAISPVGHHRFCARRRADIARHAGYG